MKEYTIINTNNKSSVIYFIRKGLNGPIKIGYTSSSVEQRIAQLQTGHHEKIYLLGTIPGSMSDEKAIHNELSEYNIQGEWFDPKAELLETIDDVIKNQRSWYYFRQVKFNKIDIECRGLRELVSELKRIIKNLEVENEQLKEKIKEISTNTAARMMKRINKITAKYNA